MKKISMTVIALLIANESHAGLFGNWRVEAPKIPGVRIDEPKVPTVGQVLNGVQKVMPVSPNSVKCANIREDADKHIKTHQATIASSQDEIAGLDKIIVRTVPAIERVKKDQEQLVKQTAILANFQRITSDLNTDAKLVKNGLMSLHQSYGDPSVQDALEEMQNQTANQTYARVAVVLQGLMQQSAEQLQDVLTQSNSDVLIGQLIELIAVSQKLAQEYKASFEATLLEQTEGLADAKARKEVLIQKINTASAGIAEQEERTACKF